MRNSSRIPSGSCGSPFFGFLLLRLSFRFAVLDRSFFASVLAAFYYGSFTGLSQDPPRIGFLSTVPSDAGQRLEDAVSAASTEQYDLPGWFSSSDIGRPSYHSPAGTKMLPPSSLSSPLSTGIGGIPMASSLPASAHGISGSNQAGQVNSAQERMQVGSAATLWCSFFTLAMWTFSRMLA